MPTEGAVRRERAVVEQVVAPIRSASRLQVSIDGWPDVERNNKYPAQLTVEAVLRLADDHGEHLWALDVMAVAWNPRLGPARDSVDAELRRRLTELAEMHGRSIAVMYKPPVEHVDKGAAYVDAMVSRAAELLHGQADSTDDPALDPYTQIDIRLPSAASEAAVMLMHSLTDTASSSDQIRATLLPPLQSKLTNQLHRAHDAGFPTILALDRLGGDPRLGGNWLASATVISQVVSQAIAHHGHATGSHVVDLVVLVDEASCSPIYGYWPDTPEP